MKRHDLIRHLESQGCYLLRDKGKHSVYANPREQPDFRRAAAPGDQRLPCPEDLPRFGHSRTVTIQTRRFIGYDGGTNDPGEPSVPMFDRERLTDDLPPAGAFFVGGFFVCWTLFAGFCFVFGILFSVAIVVMSIRAWLLGVPQNGNPLVFFAILVPMMAFYEYVSWRFFRFGLSILWGDPRRHDPFDADGQTKRYPSEAD